MYLTSNTFLYLYRIEEEEWDGSDISDDEDDLGQGVGPEFASVQMFLAATGTSIKQEQSLHRSKVI